MPSPTPPRTWHPIDLALRNPGDQLALGRVAVTTNLTRQLGGEPDAYAVLLPLLRRHARGDWGEVTDDDRATNNEALAAGEGRVMSIYRVPGADAPVEVWIITEADRSYTTALAPDDY